MSNILDGTKVAASCRQDIAREVINIKAETGRAPVLAVIIVGHDPASEVYVMHKQRACQEVGIISEKFHLPYETTQETLLNLIHELNTNPSVDGILVQLPLPAHFDPSDVLETIDPNKDVDGFHPYNMGRLVQRHPAIRPCTPKGVMVLLDHVHCDYQNSDAVVIGSSTIVGRPMAMELLAAGATVTICHSGTRDLIRYLKFADIVVCAIGKPRFIRGEWLKEGSTIIDVGINRLQSGRLVGDIDFDSAVNRVKWITPVPGGVGPMTVAMLLQNTLLAMQMRR